MTRNPDTKCRNCTHTRFQHNPITNNCVRSHGCKCTEFDGRSEAEVVGQRMQVTDLSDVPFESQKRAWRIAGVLLEAYGRTEPEHPISQYPISYQATFVDMATALLESERVIWHEHLDTMCCPGHNHHVSPHRKCIMR